MEVSSLWKELPITILKPVRQKSGLRLLSNRVSDRGFHIRGLRQFEIGDSFRAVSRKHYARTGDEIIIERFTEQNALILFLLDVSASMHIGAARRKIDAGFALLRCLGSACLWQGNKLQVLAFSSRIELESDVIAGFAAFERLLDELAELMPESPHTDHAQALDRTMAISEKLLAPADLVCIVSDFLFPYSLESFYRDIDTLHENTDVIALLIRDPAEENSDKTEGCLKVRDVETGEFFWLTQISSPDILQDFHKQGIEACLLSTAENEQQWYAALADFFSSRPKVFYKWQS